MWRVGYWIYRRLQGMDGSGHKGSALDWWEQSDEARKEFDHGAEHDKLKVCVRLQIFFVMLMEAVQNETDPLLEQVFVYDFVEQANLGWWLSGWKVIRKERDKRSVLPCIRPMNKPRETANCLRL
jgi:hypothetical protein